VQHKRSSNMKHGFTNGLSLAIDSAYMAALSTKVSFSTGNVLRSGWSRKTTSITAQSQGRDVPQCQCVASRHHHHHHHLANGNPGHDVTHAAGIVAVLEEIVRHHRISLISHADLTMTPSPASRGKVLFLLLGPWFVGSCSGRSTFTVGF
jgi:hypothetical protein